MASVENRVVSIKFDNSGFADKIGSTLTGLEKLKTALGFKGAGDGLKKVSDQASKFSMGNMGGAVDGVSAKFVALSTIGITALANLTSKAVDSGLRFAKAFTVQPMLDGFKEYETNMNSIQTILANTASKGSTLEDVSGALDELNTYADQTIYNFSEMTRNIGTFTAAGVDLDTSTAAIKGIANLAAISGSNSQQASTAMYQLSQAMASGTVKLMDWNSVVNAGMGGEVFQKALFEAGKAAKTLDDVPLEMTFDQWKDAGNTFRSSLESGWLTGEVLTNTLQGFTGDLTDAQIMAMGYTAEQTAEIQKMGKIGKAAATEVKTLTQLLDTVKEAVGSGWSQSFKLILGDFDEAKALFTGISEAIGGMVSEQADARNKILNGWRGLSGREVLIQGLKDGLAGLGNIIMPIKNAFRDLFPPMTITSLATLTLRFAQLMERFKEGTSTMQGGLLQTFRGVFSVFKIGIAIVKGVFTVFKSLFGVFDGAGGGLLSASAKIGRFVYDLQKVLVEGGGIAEFFDKIAAKVEKFTEKINFGKAVAAIKSFGAAVINFVQGLDFSPVVDSFKALGDGVGRLFDFFKGGFTGTFEAQGEGLLAFANKAGTGFAELIELFKELKTTVTNFVRGLDFNKPLEAISNFTDKITGLFGGGDEEGGATEVRKKLKMVSGTVDESISAFDRFKAALSSIGTFLGAVGAGITSLLGPIGTEIKTAFGGLTEDFSFKKLGAIVAGGALTGIAVSIINVINSIAGVFRMFTGVGKEFRKGLSAVTGSLEAMQNNIKADTIQKIAIALGILTISIIALSFIDILTIGTSLAALGIGLLGLVKAMEQLAVIASGPLTAAKLVAMGLAMILLSGAVLILAFGLSLMSGMDWPEMIVGLVAITGLLVALGVAVNLMAANTKGMIQTGIGILLIAGALIILGLGVKMMGSIDGPTMAKGLAGIAGGLAAIVAVLALINGPDMAKTGLGILLISVGMMFMARAVEKMGNLDMAVIAKGVAGLTGVLVALGIAMRIAGAKQSLKGAASIGVSAFALQKLADVLQIFGNLPLDTLVTGLISIAGMLLILSVALYAMTGSLAGAAALGIAAVALALLADVLVQLGETPIAVLLIGLGALAVAFIAFGIAAALLAVAAVLLAPLIPLMTALGVSVLLLGAGFALFGVGALLFATALGLVVASGAAGVALLVKVLDVLIAKLPELATALGLALGAFVIAFISTTPEILLLLVGLFQQIIDLVIENIPKAIEAFNQLVDALIVFIGEKAPELVIAGFALLIALLQGVRDNIAEVTILVAEIIVEFLNTLAGELPNIVTAGVAVLVSLIEGVTEHIEDIATAAVTLITRFMTEVGSMYQLIIDTGVEVLVDLIQGIEENIDDIGEAATELIKAFLTSVGDMVLAILQRGRQVLEELINGIEENLTDLIDVGVAAVLRFLEGVADNGAELMQGAFEIINTFVNDLAIVIETEAPRLRTSCRRLGIAIVDGATGGLWSRFENMRTQVTDFFSGMIGIAADAIGYNSPAKKFIPLGKGIGEGVAVGIDADITAENSATRLGSRVVGALKDSIDKMPMIDLGSKVKQPKFEPGYGPGPDSADTGPDQYDPNRPKPTKKPAAPVRKPGSPRPDGRSPIWDLVDAGEGIYDKGDKKPVPVVVKPGPRADGKSPIWDLIDSGTGIYDNGGTAPKVAPVVVAAPVKPTARKPGQVPLWDLINSGGGIYGSSSLTQAKAISSFSLASGSSTTPVKESTTLNFTQTVNAPTALSTSDIYRQTRSQLAIAKEELSIP